MLLDYRRFVDLPEVLGIEGDATAENGLSCWCAGNVMGFLARSTVSRWWRTSAACWPGGRAGRGYGSGPGRDYAFEQFPWRALTGLNVDNTYFVVQMHPFVEGSSEFLVGCCRARRARTRIEN